MVRSSRAQSRGVESQVSAAKGGGRFAKLPSFAPKYEMARRSKTLHMSMLSLTAVPSEVWNIAGLVRLDLGHNELPRLPPSVRPPRRSLTGTRSSSACASRGPAKRTSTPPCSIQALSRSRISGDSVPTSPTCHARDPRAMVQRRR